MANAFNISETKYVTKKLTMDVTISSKVICEQVDKNILPFSFKQIFEKQMHLVFKCKIFTT